MSSSKRKARKSEGGHWTPQMLKSNASMGAEWAGFKGGEREGLRMRAKEGAIQVRSGLNLSRFVHFRSNRQSVSVFEQILLTVDPNVALFVVLASIAL